MASGSAMRSDCSQVILKGVAYNYIYEHKTPMLLATVRKMFVAKTTFFSRIFTV